MSSFNFSQNNKRWISTSKFTTSRLVQKRVYLLAKRQFCFEINWPLECATLCVKSELGHTTVLRSLYPFLTNHVTATILCWLAQPSLQLITLLSINHFTFYSFAEDMYMNSRFLGYSMWIKSTAFIPCVCGFIVFITISATYGRIKGPKSTADNKTIEV